MPKIEVDETTFVSQRAIVDLVASIEKNPAHRTKFLEMVKSVKPDLSIPEIDAAAPLRAELDEMKKMLAEDAAARKAEKDAVAAQAQENAFLSTWRKQENSLRDEGWLDDGLDKVKEFAKTQGIPNLEAAAALYLKQNPAQIATPSANRAFDFFQPDTDTGKYFDELMKSKGDSPVAEAKLVQAALNEVRNANRRY